MQRPPFSRWDHVTGLPLAGLSWAAGHSINSCSVGSCGTVAALQGLSSTCQFKVRSAAHPAHPTHKAPGIQGLLSRASSMTSHSLLLTSVSEASSSSSAASLEAMEALGRSVEAAAAAPAANTIAATVPLRTGSGRTGLGLFGIFLTFGVVLALSPNCKLWTHVTDCKQAHQLRRVISLPGYREKEVLRSWSLTTLRLELGCLKASRESGHSTPQSLQLLNQVPPLMTSFFG